MNYDRPEILIEMAKSPPSDPIDRKLWVFLLGAISKFPTTVSGKSRTGTKSKREPDLVLELKDQSSKTLCELGIGEGTSHAHKNYKKKNAKDLARIDLGLKDALDLIQDKYGVDDAILMGYQVHEGARDHWSGIYYKIWFELALRVENGIKPVLNAAAKGKVAAVHSPLDAGKARFHTVSTPELNKLRKRA
ncbi:hypothetical protein BGX33_009460 [Mortierella sp. NVP41]|nr:hypothetical protein BGX33_009460 [Mortierella sp. NVP41]